MGLETTLRGLSSEFVRSLPRALPQDALGGGASPIRTSLALVLAAPPSWLQLSFGLVAPPRAAPQDALRGAAAPGEAVGLGDGAAHEAFGFGGGGAGDGAPQDALGLGFGGGGAGAGRGRGVGAGAAGALGAGASTFFSFRRMNAACFTIFCASDPPGGRTVATSGKGLNLAVQPAGPTPAARNATALGTVLLLPPCSSRGRDVLSCGRDHAVFWSISNFQLAPHKDTSKSSTTAPPVLATRHEAADASVNQRTGHTRGDDSAAETPETPRAKRAPLKEQTRPGDARGLPQHNAQQACPTTTSTTPRPCPHEVP